jgi:uncharacterized delta-60 repeat protein
MGSAWARVTVYLAVVVVLPGCHRNGGENDAPDGGPESRPDSATPPDDGDAPVEECSAPGALDPSFGSGGVVRLFGLNMGGPHGSGGPVNIDAAGRIVVAGEQLQPGLTQGDPVSRSCAIARLVSNGAFDPTFGGGSVVLQSVDGSPCRYQAIAFQADGKIVVAGKIDQYTEPRAIIARYLDDGQLDQDFGDRGIVLSSAQSSATSVVVDEAGRIVIAGVFGPADDDSSASWYVSRYLSDGTPDSTFGLGGVAASVFSGSGYDVAYAMAMHTKGTLVVAGSVATSFDDKARLGIVRYDPGGEKDPSFGSAGEVSLSVGDESLAGGVAVDSTARILLAGLRDAASSQGSDGVLIRLTPEGELDPAFGTGGVVVDRRGPPLMYAQVANDAAGKILAFGYEQDPVIGSQAVLARYDNVGTRDPDFGVAGFGAPLPLTGTQQVGLAMVLQPDGRPIVAGDYFTVQPQSSDIFVARYCP